MATAAIYPFYASAIAPAVVLATVQSAAPAPDATAASLRKRVSAVPPMLQKTAEAKPLADASDTDSNEMSYFTAIIAMIQKLLDLGVKLTDSNASLLKSMGELSQNLVIKMDEASQAYISALNKFKSLLDAAQDAEKLAHNFGLAMQITTCVLFALSGNFVGAFATGLLLGLEETGAMDSMVNGICKGCNIDTPAGHGAVKMTLIIAISIAAAVASHKLSKPAVEEGAAPAAASDWKATLLNPSFFQTFFQGLFLANPVNDFVTAAVNPGDDESKKNTAMWISLAINTLLAIVAVFAIKISAEKYPTGDNVMGTIARKAQTSGLWNGIKVIANIMTNRWTMLVVMGSLTALQTIWAVRAGIVRCDAGNQIKESGSKQAEVKMIDAIAQQAKQTIESIEKSNQQLMDMLAANNQRWGEVTDSMAFAAEILA